MNQDLASQSVRALIEVAIPAVNELPPGRRADCYDGVWWACRECAPELAEAARGTAQALRDADHRQLTFSHLLKKQDQE